MLEKRFDPLLKILYLMSLDLVSNQVRSSKTYALAITLHCPGQEAGLPANVWRILQLLKIFFFPSDKTALEKNIIKM